MPPPNVKKIPPKGMRKWRPRALLSETKSFATTVYIYHFTRVKELSLSVWMTICDVLAFMLALFRRSSSTENCAELSSCSRLSSSDRLLLRVETCLVELCAAGGAYWPRKLGRRGPQLLGWLSVDGGVGTPPRGPAPRPGGEGGRRSNHLHFV